MRTSPLAVATSETHDHADEAIRKLQDAGFALTSLAVVNPG